MKTLIFSSAAFVALCGFGEAETSCPQVKFDSAMEVEGVGQFATGDTFTPTGNPCIYRMRPVLAEGEKTFCIESSSKPFAANHYCFPKRSDGDWVCVALAGDEVVTLTARKATDIRYVDAVNGNNEWDGTTDYAHRNEPLGHGPKLSLQEANDVGTGDYPIVFAAPGYYTNGVSTVTDSSYSCKRRLSSTKRVAIFSMEGADKTFIIGEPDPTTKGLGDGAVAGVYMKSTGPQCIQGFTITGCYTPASSSKNILKGAAFCADSKRAHLIDCILTNNYAHSGVVSYGVVERSRIADNEVVQYVMYGSALVACEIAGNRMTNGNSKNSADAAFGSGYVIGCTIDLRNTLNTTGRHRLCQSGVSEVEGCIIAGFLEDEIDGPCSHVLVSDDPVFANATAHDYRLGMLSPALDAFGYGEMGLSFRQTMVADVDGRPILLNNGMARLGAEWNEPLAVSVVGGEKGGFEVVSGKLGTNVVDSTTPIVINATDVETRPFVGFEVNGAIQSYEGTTITVNPSLAVGTVTTVKAIYGTTWYVDCLKGKSGNTGGRPDQAFATIRAATTLAAADDEIRVSRGSYGLAEGSQKHVSTANLESRVVVPASVTLVADDPENTYIVGQASTTPQDDYGNGPGAIRCVYLNAGAVIRGFTLTGGHTYGDTTGFTDADGMGSAVLGSGEANSTVMDCVVSNNTVRQGTLHDTRNIKCRVVYNTATYRGAAGRNCSWYGCIIDHTKCKEQGTINAPVGMIDSCTFGTDNKDLNNGSPQVVYGYTQPYLMYNTVVLYGRFYGTPCATNCAFLSTATGSSLKAENCSNCVWLANAAAAKISADYQLASESPLIDAGNALFAYENMEGVDIGKGQRIMNGQIDIGAYEYDWRPVYAKKLGSQITVTTASPLVTNAVDGVTILAGELEGIIGRKGQAGSTFEIIGDGALSVFVNDKLIGTYTSGITEARIGEVEDGATFRFAYAPGEADAGYARICNLGVKAGLVLIVR